MGKSSIAWTDFTFNPWVGCTKVSEGCRNCYALSYDKRVGGGIDPKDGVKKLRWGPTAPRVRTKTWKEPLKWNRQAEAEGVRKRVFCASLADVFEDRAELVAWRADLFALIADTPHLDWLLLTKRPENIKRLWPTTIPAASDGDDGCPPPGPASWPNVWLGTTVEDQQRANERIPHLLAVPAVVRFLSCEPLLERVTLNPWLLSEHGRRHIGARPGINWVIVGGESGGGARRFEAEWVRALVRQCHKAGVAPFVKQMGANVIDRNDAGFNGEDDDGWHSAVEYGGEIRVEHDIDGFRDDYQGAPVRVHLRDGHGGDMAEWPADLRIREFPEVTR